VWPCCERYSKVHLSRDFRNTRTPFSSTQCNSTVQSVDLMVTWRRDKGFTPALEDINVLMLVLKSVVTVMDKQGNLRHLRALQDFCGHPGSVLVHLLHHSRYLHPPVEKLQDGTSTPTLSSTLCGLLTLTLGVKKFSPLSSQDTIFISFLTSIL
jgi:hypothetical protein